MRLLLVRHGETDHNACRRFQGHAGTALNDRGRRQAAALALALRGEGIEAAYCSDLPRARETAGLLGFAAVDAPALRELDFGEWEGLTFDEARLRDPDAADRWAAEPDAFPPPGGETLAALDTRVRSFLRRAAEAHDGRTVLAVSHAGPIRVLACAAVGLPRGSHGRFVVSPGSLSELVFHPGGSFLARLNVVPPGTPNEERTGRGWDA